MAGGRGVDAEIAREIGQQAHRREFGGADREAAHRQREQHQRGVGGMAVGSGGGKRGHGAHHRCCVAACKAVYRVSAVRLVESKAIRLTTAAPAM